MTKTILQTDILSSRDAMFVVRYTGRYSGFYVIRILPFIFIFLIFAALYLDDQSRWIFSRRSMRKPFSWFEFCALLAFVAAGIVDLLLTLRRVHAGAVALQISKNGISGAVRHLTRVIPWSEIEDVSSKGTHIVVRRQPRTLLQKLFATRGLGNINLPAHQLDSTFSDILAAAYSFAPLSSPLRGNGPNKS